MPTTAAEIPVAVGVILRNGALLIARRLPHQHLGGFWEFPGGKCEADESIESALYRELKEELAIDVVTAKPLTEVLHDYAEKRVRLICYLVTEFSGTPEGLDGQEIAWVQIDDIGEYPLPPANQKILNILQQKLQESSASFR